MSPRSNQIKPNQNQPNTRQNKDKSKFSFVVLDSDPAALIFEKLSRSCRYCMRDTVGIACLCLWNKNLISIVVK